MKAHGTAAPARAPQVEWAVLDGEAVLHDLDTGTVHKLNPTATAVWQACDGSRASEAIVDALRAAFSGPPETIDREVRELLAWLRDLGLVVGPPG